MKTPLFFALLFCFPVSSLAGKKPQTYDYRVAQRDDGVDLMVTPKLPRLTRLDEVMLEAELRKAAGPGSFVMISQTADETKITVTGTLPNLPNVILLLERRLGIRLKKATSAFGARGLPPPRFFF